MSLAPPAILECLPLPMVAPDIEVSAEQASGRPVVLHAASVKDHNYAVARVAIAYIKHVETKAAC